MKGYLHLSVVHKTLQDVERLDSAPCLTNNGHCPSNSMCVPINNGLGPGGMTHTCFTMRRATKVVKKTGKFIFLRFICIKTSGVGGG